MLLKSLRVAFDWFKLWRKRQEPAETVGYCFLWLQGSSVKSQDLKQNWGHDRNFGIQYFWSLIGSKNRIYCPFLIVHRCISDRLPGLWWHKNEICMYVYIYMLFKRDIWICQSREGPNVLSNWKRSAIFICPHFPRVVPINVKMFYPSFTNIYSEVLLLMLQSSDMTRVSLLALSFYIFRKGKQVQYLRERTGQTFMATKYH